MLQIRACTWWGPPYCLRNHFSHVVLYHGGRPDDVALLMSVEVEVMMFVLERNGRSQREERAGGENVADEHVECLSDGENFGNLLV